MASNRDNEIMNRLMELNKKRFIPKRRKFTKAEQTEFDLLFFGFGESTTEARPPYFRISINRERVSGVTAI